MLLLGDRGRTDRQGLQPGGRTGRLRRRVPPFGGERALSGCPVLRAPEPGAGRGGGLRGEIWVRSRLRPPSAQSRRVLRRHRLGQFPPPPGGGADSRPRRPGHRRYADRDASAARGCTGAAAVGPHRPGHPALRPHQAQIYRRRQGVL